jgi:antitoxin component YwqK of YwqJK toxin-antitoxin module
MSNRDGARRTGRDAKSKIGARWVLECDQKKPCGYEKYKTALQLSGANYMMLKIYDASLYNETIQDQKKLIAGEISDEDLSEFIRSVENKMLKCYELDNTDGIHFCRNVY